LHALELEEQYYYRSIRSEVVIVDYHNDLFPDVKTFSKIEKVTEMALIKTRKFYGGIDYGEDQLWFGRPIDQKKLQEWKSDLINGLYITDPGI
jgi:hypothetical protein